MSEQGLPKPPVVQPGGPPVAPVAPGDPPVGSPVAPVGPPGGQPGDPPPEDPPVAPAVQPGGPPVDPPPVAPLAQPEAPQPVAPLAQPVAPPPIIFVDNSKEVLTINGKTGLDKVLKKYDIGLSIEEVPILKSTDTMIQKANENSDLKLIVHLNDVTSDRIKFFLNYYRSINPDTWLLIKDQLTLVKDFNEGIEYYNAFCNNYKVYEEIQTGIETIKNMFTNVKKSNIESLKEKCEEFDIVAILKKHKQFANNPKIKECNAIRENFLALTYIYEILYLRKANKQISNVIKINNEKEEKDVFENITTQELELIYDELQKTGAKLLKRLGQVHEDRVKGKETQQKQRGLRFKDVTQSTWTLFRENPYGAELNSTLYALFEKAITSGATTDNFSSLWLKNDTFIDKVDDLLKTDVASIYDTEALTKWNDAANDTEKENYYYYFDNEDVGDVNKFLDMCRKLNVTPEYKTNIDKLTNIFNVYFSDMKTDEKKQQNFKKWCTFFIAYEKVFENLPEYIHIARDDFNSKIRYNIIYDAIAPKEEIALDSKPTSLGDVQATNVFLTQEGNEKTTIQNVIDILRPQISSQNVPTIYALSYVYVQKLMNKFTSDQKNNLTKLTRTFILEFVAKNYSLAAKLAINDAQTINDKNDKINDKYALQRALAIATDAVRNALKIVEPAKEPDINNDAEMIKYYDGKTELTKEQVTKLNTLCQGSAATEQMTLDDFLKLPLNFVKLSVVSKEDYLYHALDIFFKIKDKPAATAAPEPVAVAGGGFFDKLKDIVKLIKDEKTDIIIVSLATNIESITDDQIGSALDAKQHPLNVLDDIIQTYKQKIIKQALNITDDSPENKVFLGLADYKWGDEYFMAEQMTRNIANYLLKKSDVDENALVDYIFDHYQILCLSEYAPAAEKNINLNEAVKKIQIAAKNVLAAATETGQKDVIKIAKSFFAKAELAVTSKTTKAVKEANEAAEQVVKAVKDTKEIKAMTAVKAAEAAAVEAQEAVAAIKVAVEAHNEAIIKRIAAQEAETKAAQEAETKAETKAKAAVNTLNAKVTAALKAATKAVDIFKKLYELKTTADALKEAANKLTATEIENILTVEEIDTAVKAANNLTTAAKNAVEAAETENVKALEKTKVAAYAAVTETLATLMIVTNTFETAPSQEIGFIEGTWNGAKKVGSSTLKMIGIGKTATEAKKDSKPIELPKEFTQFINDISPVALDNDITKTRKVYYLLIFIYLLAKNPSVFEKEGVKDILEYFRTTKEELTRANTNYSPNLQFLKYIKITDIPINAPTTKKDDTVDSDTIDRIYKLMNEPATAAAAGTGTATAAAAGTDTALHFPYYVFKSGTKKTLKIGLNDKFMQSFQAYIKNTAYTRPDDYPMIKALSKISRGIFDGKKISKSQRQIETIVDAATEIMNKYKKLDFNNKKEPTYNTNLIIEINKQYTILKEKYREIKDTKHFIDALYEDYKDAKLVLVADKKDIYTNEFFKEFFAIAELNKTNFVIHMLKTTPENTDFFINLMKKIGEKLNNIDPIVLAIYDPKFEERITALAKEPADDNLKGGAFGALKKMLKAGDFKKKINELFKESNPEIIEPLLKLHEKKVDLDNFKLINTDSLLRPLFGGKDDYKEMKTLAEHKDNYVIPQIKEATPAAVEKPAAAAAAEKPAAKKTQDEEDRAKMAEYQAIRSANLEDMYKQRKDIDSARTDFYAKKSANLPMQTQTLPGQMFTAQPGQPFIVQAKPGQQPSKYSPGPTTATVMSQSIVGDKKHDKKRAIEKYLKEVSNFIQMLKTRNDKWDNDIGIFLAPDKLADEIEFKCYRLREKKDLKPGEAKKLQNQINNGYKKMMRMVEGRVKLNFALNQEFFIKTHRRRLREIARYIIKYMFLLDLKKDADPAMSDKEKEEHEALQKNIAFYEQVKGDFENYMAEIERSNDKYYESLKNYTDNNILLYGTSDDKGADGIMLLPDAMRVNLSNKYEDLHEFIAKTQNKLKSYYTLNNKLMDLILDAQFLVMYIIKAIRIGYTYVALFLTTRVFSPIYEERVYDQKKMPPELILYLLIFLTFDVALNLFLVVVLFLLQFLFKTDDNTFVVNKYLFQKYLVDYLVSIVLLVFVGFMISRVIMDKKYFKYKYEGLRAIRAFETMMFRISIPMTLFPYFLLF